MFGHDDQSQRHHETNLPSPDGAIIGDTVQPASTPQVDDTAGDFIDSDAAPTPAATAPIANEPADTTVAPSQPVGGHPNADALLDIKQQALQQLTPLIGHLEQSPEEKFRTTMMMIQAADNDVLIKDAYEAALQIPDEKVRAQALLDIVNEINYFTHASSGSEAA